MDQDLSRRIEILGQTGDDAARAAAAVRREVESLNGRLPMTEDTAGMFVSHLFTAVVRMLAGETELEAPDPALYAEVVRQRPDAIDLAREIARDLHDTEGIDVPDAETQFIAFHVGGLLEIADPSSSPTTD